jgi:hypothetical protein
MMSDDEKNNKAEDGTEDAAASETMAAENVVSAENFQDAGGGLSLEPDEPEYADDTVDFGAPAAEGEMAEPVETTESVEAAEVVEPVETAEPFETAEIVEPVETAEPFETAEVVEPVETVEPFETAEVIEPVETVEPFETAEFTELVGEAEEAVFDGGEGGYNDGLSGDVDPFDDNVGDLDFDSGLDFGDETGFDDDNAGFSTSNADYSNVIHGGKSKKLLLPLILLVVAFGIGGYVVMSSDLLESEESISLPVANNYAQNNASNPYVAPPSQPINPMPNQTAANNTPPMPVINEVPQGNMPPMPGQVANNIQDNYVQPAVNNQAAYNSGNNTPANVTNNNIYPEQTANAAAVYIDEDDDGFTNFIDDSEPEIIEDNSSDSDEYYFDKPVFSNTSTTDDEDDLFEPEVNVIEVSSKKRDVSKPKTKVRSDVYFDAESTVTPAEPELDPRNINPAVVPGQTYVVINDVVEDNNPESLLVAANRALKLKRYDAALEMFDNLYSRNNRDTRILMGRAIALQNIGRDDAAIMTYEFCVISIHLLLYVD